MREYYIAVVASLMMSIGSFGSILPNPVISRGATIYASHNSDRVDNLSDGDFSTDWHTGDSRGENNVTPCWVAYNIGAGPSRLLAYFSTQTWGNYDSEANTLTDYVIEVSNDSSDGSDGTWTAVSTVVGNTYSARTHVFEFSGYSWIRLSISNWNKAGAWGEGAINAFELHDVSAGYEDTYFFMGDSITAGAFRRFQVQPDFSVLINSTFPDHNPVMVEGGIGGTTANNWGTNITTLIQAMPEIEYWAVAFGMNDSWGDNTGNAQRISSYKDNMEYIVTNVLNAGKTPIIPQISFANDGNHDAIPQYNVVLRELEAEYNLIPGPDFYTFFQNNPDLLADGVHPTTEGYVEMNRIWAEHMEPFYGTDNPVIITNFTATPDRIEQGTAATVTCSLYAHTSAAGASISDVTLNLSPLGGSTNQSMTAQSDGLFSWDFNVPAETAAGSITITATAADSSNNVASADIDILIYEEYQGMLITWRGQELLLSGCNVAWESYGADFGMVEEWGNHNGYSHAATKSMFEALSAADCNCVRWWVFCDGRAAPEFSADSGGTVTGLDASVLPNMEDAINLAASNGIYLVFCLWDFGMLHSDSTAAGNGEHAGAHGNLIMDPAARDTFINNALLPMLQHPVSDTGYTIGTHPNVLAWEIMNEPEWGIIESGSDKSEFGETVTLAQMQEFVATLAGIIHRNSNQLVTLGSASLKWNSDTTLGATGNWWKDSALTPYDPDGALDFYQVHYYGWMNGDYTTYSYSPLFTSAADAGLDKPTVIGEFPANGNGTSWITSEIIEGCHSNGYCGAWAWTYMGNDTEGNWSDCSSAYEQYAADHRNIIRPEPGFDRDGDGVADSDEFIAGTDPGSDSSIPILKVQQTNGMISVNFETIEAEGIGYGGVERYYTLEQHTNLTAGTGWEPITGMHELPATNGSARYDHSLTNASPAFFRTRTWLQNR